jgi:hypothetical protein
MEPKDQDSPKSPKTRKSVRKKASGKRAPRKTASSKTARGKPRKKKAVRAEKTGKRSAPSSRKSAGGESQSGMLHSFSQRTMKILDSLMDDVRELPKKTSELKNSQMVDSVTRMIHRTREQFLEKKKEFAELHVLNVDIASDKRKIVQKNALLGKKTFDLMDQHKLEAPALEKLFSEIRALRQDLKAKEAKRKKIQEKS